MALFRCAVYLALVACVAAEVTPIDKVITLIEDMKSEVEGEGRDEAKAYGEFACFCKKTSGKKSTSITKGNDNIDVLSADIADKTQSKKGATTELAKRKDDQVSMSNKLQESESSWAKELAEYQLQEADYNKAISSLKQAIKSMKATGGAASLLQSVKEDLSHTLKLADAMDMVAAPKHRAIALFLQGTAKVDPSDPDYEYHSGDILDLLTSLHTDFTDNKKTLDDEHAKAKKAMLAYQASLKKKMGSNKLAMDSLVKSIDKLEKEIAKHRQDLIETQSQLQDDEQYIKDLTKQCEDRANDFDQRSAMRDDEITALSTALKVLKDEVKPADSVNVRALFIQKPKAEGSDSTAVTVEPQILPAVVTERKEALSLLQEVQSHAKSFQMRGSLAVEDRKNRALSMLSSEGNRLNSLVLTSLAAQSAGDPFKKVKGLIERLIQRLLTESKNEATKKGFCDTELGKARKDRDFRWEEANDISATLAGLEAKEDALTEEIKQLTQGLKDENLALKETTKERKEEKEINLESIKTAKDGHEAVSEALQVLRSFYKQAAKAVFLQASPVDEDTSGPGFAGAYSGNQSGSHAVLALLETIQSDFDRTIRTTEAAEEAAHRDYVDFSQHAKASIAGKETKKELDEQDLKTTKMSIETKTEDLHTAMDLLDAAYKELEDLKPTCLDTGMSYSERVKKREEEMKALKNALCILDADNVEPECK